MRPPAAIFTDLAANSAARAKLEAELAEALQAAAATPERPVVAPTRYLTTREAAGLLGVSERHLAALRASGSGPEFVRIGAAIRYPFDGLVVGR